MSNNALNWPLFDWVWFGSVWFGILDGGTGANIKYYQSSLFAKLKIELVCCDVGVD